MFQFPFRSGSSRPDLSACAELKERLAQCTQGWYLPSTSLEQLNKCQPISQDYADCRDMAIKRQQILRLDPEADVEFILKNYRYLDPKAKHINFNNDTSKNNTSNNKNNNIN